MSDSHTGRSAGYTYAEAQALARERGEEVTADFCPMCGPGGRACRVCAFTKDGRLLRVMGMAEGAMNRGGICARGLASPEWLYSPDRLKKPLLRVGEKGEGRFREISWDEAVAIAAEKLREQKAKYGPESLAILSPNHRNYKDIILRFLSVHGSPNHAHSGICAMQRAFAFHYTVGASPQCDYVRSKLIIYWGRQPVYSGPAGPGARELLAAKARGAKTVAIKPSMEADSAKADLWLPIRPGTDAALALALLNVVLEEELIDRDFAGKWCFGLAELREHVKQYPPEWAEHICGIAAGDIRALAREYAAEPAACIDVGNGLEHAPSCCDAVRAIAMLMALTGHLDRPGCNFFPSGDGPQPQSLRRPDLWTPELVSKINAPEFPLAFQPFMEGPATAYYKTIESVLTGEPYPVRCLIAPGTQPVVSNRGSKNVVEALKKLDFFIVLDVMKTAEMAYADLVIPVTTGWESPYPFEVQSGRAIARPGTVKPLGDYKSTVEFFLDLAVAMGYGGDFWNGDPEAMEAWRIEPLGISMEELRAAPLGVEISKPQPKKYEKYAEIFSAKSPAIGRPLFLREGKVALWSSALANAGFEPLPVWREPPESITGTPELLERYPLLLSDYHTTKNFNASWLRNVPSLRALTPEPELHIHPSAAKTRGIAHGQWVRVESPHGHIRVKACYYEGIRPDTVMLAHGWWQGCGELGLPDLPLCDGGANVNDLYSVAPEAYDPLVTAMSSQTLVEVKADE